MFSAARPLWAFVLTSLTAAAGAQTAEPAAQQQSGLIDLTYRSTLHSYQRFSEEKVGSWRDANDNVGRIGGWREYAKESRQPDATGSTPPSGSGSTAPSGSTDPHAGHGKQQ